MVGFYAPRDRILPPLLWPSIAPPFTVYGSGREFIQSSLSNAANIGSGLRLEVGACSRSRANLAASARLLGHAAHTLSGSG